MSNLLEGLSLNIDFHWTYLWRGYEQLRPWPQLMASGQHQSCKLSSKKEQDGNPGAAGLALCVAGKLGSI